MGNVKSFVSTLGINRLGGVFECQKLDREIENAIESALTDGKMPKFELTVCDILGGCHCEHKGVFKSCHVDTYYVVKELCSKGILNRCALWLGRNEPTDEGEWN